MKTSVSIDLVWQLAGQEAIASQFKEIGPEHFLEALLKLSELPVEEVDRIAPGADAARTLSAEVHAVRDVLKRRSIDPTLVRRELRARLGKGDSPFEGERLHRSTATRDMFDRAAQLAADSRSDTLEARHLLEATLSSPTPAMIEVLGSACNGEVPHGDPDSLLAQHGTDLTGLAAEGKLSAHGNREAECKAIIQALAEGDRKSVFLITDAPGDECDEAVEAVAVAIANGEVPALLKSRRIIDIRGAGEGVARLEDFLKLRSDLRAEAEKNPDVILVERIGTAAHQDHAEDAALKKSIKQRTVQSIFTLTSSGYHRLIDADPSWKRFAHILWVQEEPKREVPWEL